MGLGLSVLAFAACYIAGRRSLGTGVFVTLAFGYFYAVIRARVFDTYTHFLFDAAVLGLYLARFTLPRSVFLPFQASVLGQWLLLLIGWPCLVFCLCFIFPQHPLIQMIGLRAAVWFLPFLLLGAATDEEDLFVIARGIAVLNGLALGIAIVEYIFGLGSIFPRNAITELMYRTSDVGVLNLHRIPGPFSSAAMYGSVMVASVPLLVGCWRARRHSFLVNLLFASGLVSAALGTFICGSRSPVIVLLILVGAIAYWLRTRFSYVVVGAMLSGLVGYLVSGYERLQRFTTLQDPEVILYRFQTSVHLGFLEQLVEFPMGAGLCSAFGTTIPYFLQHLSTQEPIGIENEYARIALEQGIIGLLLWLAFVRWVLFHRRLLPSRQWSLGVNLMIVWVSVVWVTAVLGAGMMTAMPGTPLLLLQMGILARTNGRANEEKASEPSRTRKHQEIPKKEMVS